MEVTVRTGQPDQRYLNPLGFPAAESAHRVRPGRGRSTGRREARESPGPSLELSLYATLRRNAVVGTAAMTLIAGACLAAPPSHDDPTGAPVPVAAPPAARDPADPVEEIKVGFDILKSLGLRHRGVNIIACPSCARQGFNVIKTVEALEARLAHISTPLSLSIIGCVVNGPGEALMTDLGFTGGGKGAGMVYVAGRQDHKVDNEQMVDHIVELVEARAAEIAGAGIPAAAE